MKPTLIMVRKSWVYQLSNGQRAYVTADINNDNSVSSGYCVAYNNKTQNFRSFNEAMEYLEKLPD